MCTYLFVGVGNFRGDAAAAFRARGFDAKQTTAVAAIALPAKTVHLVVTRGGCSCGLHVSDTAPDTLDLEGRRQRYRRRGWTETKIERALASARQRTGHERSDALAEKFGEAITELAAAGARLWLLAHEYSGSEDERVELTGVTEMPLAYFLRTKNAFPEDRLIQIIG